MRPREAAPGPRGFSLIELMAAILVMSILLALALPSLSRWTGADVRRSSAQVASTLRYVFEEATIRRVAMRVTFNLDRGTWQVEEASGEARIFRSEEKRKEAAERALLDDEERRELLDLQAREQQEQAQALTEAQGSLGFDPTAGAGGLLSGLFSGGGAGAVVKPYDGLNRFGPPEDEELAKARTLPDGVRFAGAWTPAFDDVRRPAEDGPPEEPEDEAVVHVHVFPSGYIEDAVVYVGSGEDVVTVRTEPLTGRVRVEDGEVDPRSLRLDEREVER